MGYSELEIKIALMEERVNRSMQVIPAAISYPFNQKK